ncbi:c-type cytochrome domain-containing protein [Gracilimonas sp.]|uniref:c-type cytochrome domain-containing protein n=1 Tax=Gracilimonas sp. TaxID=1974203 RepID=UPI003BAD9769
MYHPLTALLLFVLFFSIGCISNVEDISETPDINPNDISYSADIQPIFTSSCGSCHINSSTNGVNLTSYSTTINSTGSVAGGPIVVPGEPENSPLVEKIKPDPSYGSRMPTTGQYLTPTEIAKIEAWITGGAEDN